jgi:hypothetical protein
MLLCDDFRCCDLSFVPSVQPDTPRNRIVPEPGIEILRDLLSKPESEECGNEERLFIGRVCQTRIEQIRDSL